MDVSPKQLVSVAAQLDSVPGARRRQPRVDGFEHATPGRAAARHRSAAGRHRPGRARRPRFPRRAGGRRSRQSRLRHRQPDHHHRGRQDARRRKRSSSTTRRTASGFIRSANSCAPTPRTCINQKILVAQGRARQEGPGHRRRPLHAERRTGAGPQRARARSCRGTATTSRTPSSSARRS